MLNNRTFSDEPRPAVLHIAAVGPAVGPAVGLVRSEKCPDMSGHVRVGPSRSQLVRVGLSRSLCVSLGLPLHSHMKIYRVKVDDKKPFVNVMLIVLGF